MQSRNNNHLFTAEYLPQLALSSRPLHASRCPVASRYRNLVDGRDEVACYAGGIGRRELLVRRDSCSSRLHARKRLEESRFRAGATDEWQEECVLVGLLACQE